MLERFPPATCTNSSPRHGVACDLGGPVPYIHVTLAVGRPTELKRRLIGGLTDMMEDVLEVARSDIHVLLWEIPTENIGEGGREPAADVTNNVTVVMSQGRPSDVVLVLIKSLTDVVEAVLEVTRENVHLVVLEEPFTRIGEAGIPMEPPRVPHWYYHDTVARHER
jgi:4-oxalocrotonate tautomerase family enzyme